MTSDEIRERYLGFFEERGHLRLPSASLVPPPSDTSVLLTTAGMQPLKPYFRGLEEPPRRRLTSCQKVFRTVDIDRVGSTTRHLTTFEMLGNFSIGDYFKEGAIGFALELSRDVLRLDVDDIWITVFEGDEALGLGPDEEAIEAWLAAGIPRERIVPCPRSENFWQAGPTGPCGPCSELYLDRGVAHGSPDDLPGGENERFLEYWNLVFMQYDQVEPDRLIDLPARNIDTGLGLNRMAAILQDVPSVFETDQFAPLIALGEELSGVRYGSSQRADRALRILADHSRGASFLLADGVVPSNEERGYVLRRIMRRAIQQARTLEMPDGFTARYADAVEDIMGAAYPELREQHDAIRTWLAAEEQSFSRTLAEGTRMLDELIARARDAGAGEIDAADAFTLHDTYGFPFDLTRELVGEAGLEVSQQGFDELMEGQRSRARSAAAGASHDAARERALALAQESAVPTAFTGYETERQATTVDVVERVNGRVLLKLGESPFYAAGGGQVSDAGVIECADGDCRARVAEVYRVGEDQVIAVEPQEGELRAGERVVARVDRAARHATECNHTATHLLHAALRARLGDHVRQAGSYVGPDKLRFDFSHRAALTPGELRDVEDQINAWIARNDPVRPIVTTLDEARALGAMALFGEKYGDVVRMVQIGEGEYSRELCGGTHVHSTAEIGVLRIVSETSSAANVRRIEALTGPAAVALLREHDELLRDVAATLRVSPAEAAEAVRAREQRRREIERELKKGAQQGGGVDVDALTEQAVAVDGGARVLSARVDAPDAKALLAIADRVAPRLGEAGALVLGSADDERVHLVARVAPALVARGLKAGEVVRAAAAITGGGGGGRDTSAQAGGRDPARLDEALAVAREQMVAALGPR